MAEAILKLDSYDSFGRSPLGKQSSLSTVSLLERSKERKPHLINNKQ